MINGMSARRKCHVKAPGSVDLVEAALVDDLSKDDLIRAHLDWAPVRLAALKRLHEAQRYGGRVLTAACSMDRKGPTKRARTMAPQRFQSIGAVATPTCLSAPP
jgi:hypothetical protein